jgi:hypothetical protein
MIPAERVDMSTPVAKQSLSPEGPFQNTTAALNETSKTIPNDLVMSKMNTRTKEKLNLAGMEEVGMPGGQANRRSQFGPCWWCLIGYIS